MTDATKPATVRIGDSVAEFAVRAFDPAVWDKATMCLLDALGLAQIARSENTTLAMRDLSTVTTTQGARLWPYGVKASLAEAVAANAVAVHGHFHDDSDPASWCHPGSLIVPAAVGVSEVSGGTLETVLRSIIAGYSTLNWLGAKEHVAHALIKRGIRTSPAFGTIGAAAAASVGLHLDAGQSANAVAIAASITGGTLEPLRCVSDEWRVQNAQAARGGVLAAQLAARNVQGAVTALDGSKGVLQSLAGLMSIPELWKIPLRPDAILDIYAKPWATLGDNMAAVRAAKLMHDDGIDVKQIESIQVTIWRAYAEYPGTSFKGPFVLPVQALASTGFATAAMLLLGDLEYDVSLNQRENAALLDLVQRVEVLPSDVGTKLDAVLTVTFSDGSTRTRHASDAPRNWLYHDPERAIAIFEQRLVSTGYPVDAGREMASALFAEGARGQSIVSILDRFARHQPGL